MSSILIDYALSRSGEQAASLSELSAMRSILIRYCQGDLSYDRAAAEYHAVRATSAPLDLLREILSIPDAAPPTPALAPIVPIARARAASSKTRQWSRDEDLRLLAAIARFGTEDWGSVANFVGSGRSKSQCHQRWTRGLDPRIVKATWTTGQDERLLMLVALYGEKSWTRIALAVGNRCDVQCRYRYNILKKLEGFKARFAAASANVHANPMLAGTPLLPLTRARKIRPKGDTAPWQKDGGDVFLEESQDADEIYSPSESSRNFEDSETSGIDESDA
jgi:hypothetical protein